MPDLRADRCAPTEPLGQRLDPTDYGWHRPDRTAGLQPPPVSPSTQAFGDFARRAIKAQPGDYARIVLRDAALTTRPGPRGPLRVRHG